jgi:hypothetical protein
MAHMLQVALQIAISIETIADNEVDKGRARQLQQRLDDWLAVLQEPQT